MNEPGLGRWLSDKEAAEAGTSDDDVERADDVSTKAKVTPFVEDTRNVLIFEPTVPLPPETMASLESALSRAIEITFQLEEYELASEALPTADDRRMLLFYESAEGGAGILRGRIDKFLKSRHDLGGKL